MFPDIFGSLSFSPSEQALVYTAEANLPTEPQPDDKYAKFRYVPDFGEGLTGRRRPTTFVLKWSDGSEDENEVEVEEWPIREGRSASDPTPLLGQVSFVNEELAVATEYYYGGDGRFLGPKACYNRPAVLTQLKSPSASATELDKPLAATSRLKDLSFRSPRVYRARDGTLNIVCLTNDLGGPHISSSELRVIDARGNSRTVVEVQQEPRQSDGFPGLYAELVLPAYPFAHLGLMDEGEVCVVTHSTWHSRMTALLIRLSDGHIVDLTSDNDQRHFSWTVLTVKGRILVCSRSAPDVPNEVVCGIIGPEGEPPTQWSVLDKPNLKPHSKCQ